MMSRFNLFGSCLLLLAWVSPFATAYDSVWTMNYTDVNDPDVALMGYMTLPPALAAEDDSTDDASTIGELPAVVILPDWDNVNNYEITRAKMISEKLGYIAFTADIYGADMHDIQDFQVKVEQATKYRSDPALFNSRIQSAINTVKGMPFVDVNRVAIIGYCLGGTGVLGYSFSNTMNSTNDIVGGVSFHGGLMDFDVTGEMASPVLVLSGGNDDAGTAVEDLESRLKEANATWQITRYSGVYHGFTKFDADAYNEWVDSRSWKEMSSFLAERFGEIEYGTKEPSLDMEYSVPLIDPADVGLDTEVGRARMSNTEESMVMVETVAYDADGFALEGYLALPPMDAGEQRPGLVILPDWDGVNGPTGYEAERAVMAAKEGRYVAMVADIYGAEFTNVDDRTTRVELATKYRSDPELFVSRIQAGIDQLMAHEAVDSNLIFVAGYCFGGTGAIDYAFSSGALKNVKAVVPIHGGLNPLRAIQTDVVQPYILILSGGVDDAHGNTTELEAHLDGASATWEISRYSNAQHGFTKWDTNPMSRYDAMADSRSWWSMMSLMDTLSSQAETVMESEEEDDHDHDKMEDSNKMGDSNKMEDSSANGLSVVSTLAMAAFVAAAMW
mmetsp:Transcript_5909/g.14287  ORF Transcript_5909/g.14287 Transcript_5909/m.14287 type:complete len:615 (-) Transcript_5909:723-2567(-)